MFTKLDDYCLGRCGNLLNFIMNRFQLSAQEAIARLIMIWILILLVYISILGRISPQAHQSLFFIWMPLSVYLWVGLIKTTRKTIDKLPSLPKSFVEKASYQQLLLKTRRLRLQLLGALVVLPVMFYLPQIPHGSYSREDFFVDIVLEGQGFFLLVVMYMVSSLVVSKK